MVIFILHKSQLGSGFLRGFVFFFFLVFFSPRKNFFITVSNYQLTTCGREGTSRLYVGLFWFLKILAGQPAGGSVSYRCIRGNKESKFRLKLRLGRLF